MILEFLVYIFILLFGVCIGSFLNCVIYRLEQKKSLKGRSFCPHCEHTLFWQDLFPIFSFLFLCGKCRYCKKKISWQYPLVELSTAILFLIIYITSFSYTIYGIASTVLLFYVFSSLVVIFVYDFKHYIIPDKILFPAIAITFLYNFLPINNVQHFISTILAVVVAAGFFLAIFLFSRGKWMGFGDVKLAILMGLLLGLPGVLAALFLAFFFGAIIGLILMILQKKSLRSEMPFGPFLIIGTFIAAIYGDQLIRLYMRFLSI